MFRKWACFGLVVMIVLSGLPEVHAYPLEDVSEAVSRGHAANGNAVASGIALGAYIPPAYPYSQEIDVFNKTVARSHPIIMHIATLSGGINESVLAQIGEIDPTPVPFVSIRPAREEALSDIAQGDYDTELRKSAAVAREFGQRIMISFADQFNYTHSPYFGDPRTYIAAWQHVHKLFAAEQVMNVEWVWSPRHASDDPTDPMSDYHQYYPGGDYVDWIGISGLNWGDSNPSALGWVTFDELFHDILVDTACRYPKPQIVGFFGSVEGPGSKTDWIKDAYRAMREYANLRAVVWFNDLAFGDQQYDFRISYTSLYGDQAGPYPPYTEGYREAISDPLFLTTLPSYDQIEPPSRVCFDLDTSSSQLVLGLEGSAQTEVTVEYAPGFTDPVDLEMEAVSGLSSAIDPVSVTPSENTASLELHASGSATPGSYQIRLRGVAEGSTNTTSIDVRVADLSFRSYLPMMISPPESPSIILGAHVPPVDPSFPESDLYYWEEIQAFNRIAGRTHPIIMYYGDLTSAFTDYLLNQLRYKLDPTPVPLVTMDPSSDVELKDIADGVYDAELKRNAGVAKRFGQPMMVIFAHEFNGSYTPYYGDPQAYIAAWRHIHDLFAREGARNIQWVWSPNYKSNRPNDPVSDYNLYYPGDSYVDWIGVSGFNWGHTRPSGWVSFDDVFGEFLVDTASRYDKPQVVSLFGSVDGPGSKADWIRNAYRGMEQYPNLRAVVWFNDFAFGNQNEADFRVTITSKYGSGPSSYSPYTDAYRKAISTERFRSTMPSYEEIKPD